MFNGSSPQDSVSAMTLDCGHAASRGATCHTPVMDIARAATPVAVGWREWVSLPEWGVDSIKAKIDTGARTSALHSFDLEFFDRDGAEWVRFGIQPWQKSDGDPVVVEALRLDHRTITSSSGTRSERPVVSAPLVLGGRQIDAEITLTRRDEMGFRMLVGREALAQGFTVDPAASYLGGKPSKTVRRLNRGQR
jgi:hypothetical protein